MPSSPSHNHKHKSSHKDKHNRSRYQTAHYGAHRQLHRDQQRTSSSSLLLDLPTESLTHVTAFLDPPSLFSLAQTCKSLYRHVGDDNTWRRAFFYQFLGVHPESTLDPQESARDGTMLMLRREEVNWKREFVARWNLRRRWERTRSSSTISHVPVHSSVSDIYLLAPDTRAAPVLLTASLTYGVVARSQPLTGKISKGYLDASGTLNGFGHGNPNAEFSPHLAQCVITSPGGSAAKLLWAFRTGVVAVTNTPKATDFSRPCQAQYKRCRSEDAHAGTIEHAVWVHVDGSSSRFFATAGSDGCVKVWDADHLQKSPWSSPLEKKEGAAVTVRDGCIRVAADGNTGTVAALRQSGEMTVWSGLKHLFSNESDNSNDSERTFHLPVSLAFLQPLHSDTDPRGVLSFAVHSEGSGHVSVITTYTQSAFFTKTTVDLTSEDAPSTTILGQESSGQITSIQVALPDRYHPSEKAFVVAGDVFGYISIFDLNATPTALADSTPPLPWQSAVAPFRRFAAFDGSAVTALLWTPAVLVVGSAHGVLKAFDATTFDLLREFKLSFVRTMTEKDAVTKIQVVRDLVVAAVDDRVYAWRGEPMGNLKPGRGKMRAVKMPNGLAKWHHQAEMYKDIAESQRTYEHESARTRRAFGREKEQNTTLESLGLSEVEAVEYVLMLSRDEEERKRREVEANVGVVAGTFDEDLDDVHTPVVTPAAFIEGSSSSQSRGNGRYVSRTPPSYVHAVHASRVQVSPRIRPEPMEAGSSALDSIARSVSSSSSLVGSGSASGVSLEDESHFPTMSTGVGSFAGSPQSSRSGSGSAWSTPLMMTRSENGLGGGSGSVASSTSFSDSARSFGSSVQGLDGRFAAMDVNGGGRADSVGQGGGSGAYEPGNDEDEDLRFAIELSLAEARSRGESV